MQIYITRNDEQFGPYSEADARQHVASGELSADDLAWHEGLAEWQPLSTLIHTSATTPPPPRRKVAPLTAEIPAPRPPLRRYALTAASVLLLLYLVSPYFSLWRLRAALDSGDRDSLESRIDFPSVRESLKDQLRIHMTKSVAEDKDLKDNPFGGLAAAFAPMMVNYVVDNFVTPSGISALIADSKSALAKDPDSSSPPPTTNKSIDWSKVHYAFFTSPTQFMVDIDGTKLRFRFTDFGWQLKKLEIPMNDAPGKPLADVPNATQVEPTRATATTMVAMSGGQFEMVVEDDVNKRYTVREKANGKLTTIYWSAKTNSPEIVSGDFSAIP